MKLKELLEREINQEIATLLKDGKKVRSGAMGRIGMILDADDRNVTIQLKGTKKGVTTFNIGDEVEIKKDETDRADFVVVNKE